MPQNFARIAFASVHTQLPSAPFYSLQRSLGQVCGQGSGLMSWGCGFCHSCLRTHTVLTRQDAVRALTIFTTSLSSAQNLYILFSNLQSPIYSPQYSTPQSCYSGPQVLTPNLHSMFLCQQTVPWHDCVCFLIAWVQCTHTLLDGKQASKQVVDLRLTILFFKLHAWIWLTSHMHSTLVTFQKISQCLWVIPSVGRTRPVMLRSLYLHYAVGVLE